MSATCAYERVLPSGMARTAARTASRNADGFEAGLDGDFNQLSTNERSRLEREG